MDSYEHFYAPPEPELRERFTTPKRGQTESITFRADTFHLRMLDEIIQSGVDPRLKTKSDCLQDALAMFVEDWAKNYADGLTGRTLRMFNLQQMQRQHDSRLKFVTDVEERLDEASQTGDRVALMNLIEQIHEEIEEMAKYSPKSYIEDLNKIASKIQEKLN